MVSSHRTLNSCYGILPWMKWWCHCDTWHLWVSPHHSVHPLISQHVMELSTPWVPYILHPFARRCPSLHLWWPIVCMLSLCLGFSLQKMPLWQPAMRVMWKFGIGQARGMLCWTIREGFLQLQALKKCYYNWGRVQSRIQGNDMNSSAHSLVPLLYCCVHIFLFIEKCIWNLHCDFLSEAASLKSVW